MVRVRYGWITPHRMITRSRLSPWIDSEEKNLNDERKNSPYPADSASAFMFAMAVRVATFVVNVARNRPRPTGGECDTSEWDGTSSTGGAHPNAFWTVLNVGTRYTRPRPRHKSAFSARTVSDVRDAEAVLRREWQTNRFLVRCTHTHTLTENRNLFFPYLIIYIYVRARFIYY